MKENLYWWCRMVYFDTKQNKHFSYTGPIRFCCEKYYLVNKKVYVNTNNAIIFKLKE